MPVITAAGGPPTVIEQGGTYIFTENFSDFPVATWGLNFVLQIPGSAPKTVAATTSGSNFLVTLGATTTANWNTGHYDWAEYANEISSGQRATAKTGILQVIADLSQTQPQTTAEALLEQVNTAITNLSTGGFTSVSVNNVSYTRADLSSSAVGGGLLAMRTRLQAEVIREHQAQDAFRGIDNSGLIATRFK